MKKLNIKIIFTLILLSILSINCSAHCDDEDYTRDQKEVTVHHKDSLKISTVVVD
jgi:hypothetical protein